MKNDQGLFEVVRNLRSDSAKKQKRGLHFIIASVIVWIGILIVQALSMSVLRKNFYTVMCSAPLFAFAYLISKLIKVDFKNRDNPLTGLGILFSMNQILYILIVMWIYSSVPDKMLMVYTMVFGAHLLPYGWLYRSKTYCILSVFIPIMALLIGLNFSNIVLAIIMVFAEIFFCICLVAENKSSK